MGGEWSASRPCRALPPGKGPPVPIVQEAGWAPEPGEILGQAFLRVLRFSPVDIIPPWLSTLIFIGDEQKDR
jgi:hypothetical protein